MTRCINNSEFVKLEGKSIVEAQYKVDGAIRHLEFDVEGERCSVSINTNQIADNQINTFFHLLHERVLFLTKAPLQRSNSGHSRAAFELEFYNRGVPPENSVVESVTSFIRGQSYVEITSKMLMRLVRQYIEPYFYGTPIQELTQSDLNNFKQAVCRIEGIKAANRDKTFRVIQHTINSLSLPLDISTGDKPRPDRDRIAPLSSNQVSELSAWFRTTHFHEYFQFRILTGMSTREVNTLCWFQLDFENEMYYPSVGCSKGVKFLPHMAEILSKQKSKSQGLDYVFCTPNHHLIDSHNFHRRYWRKAIDDAGLTTSISRLRDNAIINMINIGISPDTISAYTGYQDSKRLMRLYRPFINKECK